jgi:hypothetical protein
MKRTPDNDDKSHGEDKTTPDRTATTEITGDQNQTPSDQPELEKTALAALIRFFKTLDQWDREAEK